MTLAPGSRLGPYEVVALLGAGGMGEVYRARDPRLNRDIALKVLPAALADDSERIARLIREAQVLAALQHPNIAQIFGIEEAKSEAGPSSRALVMELVEGPTLAERVAAGPLDWRESVALACELAEAVAAAHERGIIHRDLKPANIKLTADGVIKVLDFGLAKACDPTVASEAIASDLGASASNSPTLSMPGATRAGMLLGTAAYMSPEQARGAAVDRRTDVWAFGCVVYELLSGQPAFNGATVSDTLAAVLRAEPDWTRLPEDLQPGVLRVLKRCLVKDRRRRVADLHDVALELSEIAAMPAAGAPAMAPPRARWLALAVAATAGLVVGGSLVWTLRTSPLPVSEVARFTVTFPSGYAIPDGGGPFGLSFSRDGRSLLFSANLRGGQDHILRAAFDGFGVEPLPGGENFAVPAVSADGEWVLFSRGEQIFRLPVSGGKATAVVGATHNRPVPGPDGRIFFAGGGAINAVPPEGGTPTAVSEPAQGLFQPHPLRDGWLLAVKAENDDIVAINTSDRRMVPLIKGRSPAVTSSGHLVFFRDGALWAVRFRPPSTVVGEPRLVLGGVASNAPASAGGFGYYALANQGHLAFVPDRPGNQRQLVWVTRRGEVASAFAEPGDFQMLRLSPDGTRAAIVERNGITILDLARMTRMRMPEDGRLERRPVWSPDNRFLTFQTQSDIFRQSADGSGVQERLVGGEGTQFPDAWSPDGTTLLFNQGAPIRDLLAWKEGQQIPILATPASERSGMFHPSGQWLAYVSDDSGRDEVYLLRWPAASGKVPVSSRGGVAPLWSRDGQEIYYREGARLMAVRFDAARGALSIPEQLFDLTPFASDDNMALWDVAADGRFLMIQNLADDRPDEIRVILNWTEELKRLLP